MKGSNDRSIVACDLATLRALPSRRDFFRLVAMGGSLVLAGGLLAACEDATNTAGLSGPGTGADLIIDFSKGDIALLQFLFILEQLEAEFYSRVVANFSNSDFTTADQIVLTDIANHEAVHREVLGALLGANGSFRITPTFGVLTFRVRAGALAAAKELEDLGAAAHDGIAPSFTDSANLALMGKIASVEGRHAAAIRDLISPLTSTFAPVAFGATASPSVVAAAIQPLIEDKLAFASAPVSFALGASASAAGVNAASDVVDALQAALLVSQLQLDLYQRGSASSGLIPSADATVFTTIAAHETAHAGAIQSLIAARGATPRSRPAFDYTAKGNLPGFAFLPTQYATFSMLSQALEDLGVRLWQSHLKILHEDRAALTLGLSMHAVQARHASEVRRLRGKKGWITGNNRDDLPAFMQAVYDGEENTTQGSANALTLAASFGGTTTATEAFDEALTVAQATPFLALFLP
ncbi:hypothetical protein BH09GEM1_BH09GEM1_13860 [soil metagenome]